MRGPVVEGLLAEWGPVERKNLRGREDFAGLAQVNRDLLFQRFGGGEFLFGADSLD